MCWDQAGLGRAWFCSHFGFVSGSIIRLLDFLNRYHFLSSVTSDRALGVGDPVILVAVGLGRIRLEISPSVIHQQ